MTGLLVAAVLLSALVFLALQREWRRLARPRHRRVVSVTLLADMQAFNEAIREASFTVAQVAERWSRGVAVLNRAMREEQPLEMPLLWEGDQA